MEHLQGLRELCFLCKILGFFSSDVGVSELLGYGTALVDSCMLSCDMLKGGI